MRVARYAWERFIETGGTSKTWLQLRPVPDRAAVFITPLGRGEERRLLTLSPEPDANMILVWRDDNGDFVSLVDARQSDNDPHPRAVGAQAGHRPVRPLPGCGLGVLHNPGCSRGLNLDAPRSP